MPLNASHLVDPWQAMTPYTCIPCEQPLSEALPPGPLQPGAAAAQQQQLQPLNGTSQQLPLGAVPLDWVSFASLGYTPVMLVASAGPMHSGMMVMSEADQCNSLVLPQLCEQSPMA